MHAILAMTDNFNYQNRNLKYEIEILWLALMIYMSAVSLRDGRPKHKIIGSEPQGQSSLTWNSWLPSNLQMKKTWITVNPWCNFWRAAK